MHSNEYIAKHASELSAECRDLLDKIFVGDEDQRITLQVRGGCVGARCMFGRA